MGLTPQGWLILMLTSVTLIYTGSSIAYYFVSRPGMALVFIGYAIANIGLIIDAL